MEEDTQARTMAAPIGTPAWAVPFHDRAAEKLAPRRRHGHGLEQRVSNLEGAVAHEVESGANLAARTEVLEEHDDAAQQFLGQDRIEMLECAVHQLCGLVSEMGMVMRTRGTMKDDLVGRAQMAHIEDAAMRIGARV